MIEMKEEVMLSLLSVSPLETERESTLSVQWSVPWRGILPLQCVWGHVEKVVNSTLDYPNPLSHYSLCPCAQEMESFNKILYSIQSSPSCFVFSFTSSFSSSPFPFTRSFRKYI